MKKKIYIAPNTLTVTLKSGSHLLDASQVGFSSSSYGGGVHRSRGGSSWDDEEDE